MSDAPDDLRKRYMGTHYGDLGGYPDNPPMVDELTEPKGFVAAGPTLAQVEALMALMEYNCKHGCRYSVSCEPGRCVERLSCLAKLREIAGVE